MDQQEIMEKLTKIFQDEFDDDELIIFEDMTPDDIDDWDSMTMVSLMSNIASEFSLKFSMGELKKIHSIGDIVRMIIDRK